MLGNLGQLGGAGIGHEKLHRLVRRNRSHRARSHGRDGLFRFGELECLGDLLTEALVLGVGAHALQRLRETLRHRVQRRPDHADLVTGRFVVAHLEIAFGQGSCDRRNVADRAPNRARDRPGQQRTDADDQGCAPSDQ